MLHPTPPTVFACTSMRCHVYKSRTRPDTFVYLAEPEGLEALPAALRTFLGKLEPALEFDLTPQRRLARAEATSVIAALDAHGYYLQAPPHLAEPE